MKPEKDIYKFKFTKKCWLNKKRSYSVEMMPLMMITIKLVMERNTFPKHISYMFVYQGIEKIHKNVYFPQDLSIIKIRNYAKWYTKFKSEIFKICTYNFQNVPLFSATL